MTKLIEQSMAQQVKTKQESTTILNRYVPKGKKINILSKTIVKIHKDNPYIQRYREFNEQNSIEPYEGL